MPVGTVVKMAPVKESFAACSEPSADNSSATAAAGRNREEKEEREGYYRSERSYGRFYRNIPFREGIEADEAEASFKDGVLEVTLKTRKNGRTIEIR